MSAVSLFLARVRSRAGSAAVAMVLLLGAVPALAQRRVATGEPLAVVQVGVKGQPALGAAGRDNGTFTISVPMQDVVLLVRRIGYPATEVSVPATMTAVTVTLKKDPHKLDEVVVTGQAS